MESESNTEATSHDDSDDSMMSSLANNNDSDEPTDSDDDSELSTESSNSEGAAEESENDEEEGGGWFLRFERSTDDIVDNHDDSPTLFDMLEDIDVYVEWNLMEHVIFKDPSQLYNYFNDELAITTVLKHRPPLYVVKAMLHGHPDSILGNNDDDDDNSRVLPMQTAYENGAAPEVIQYLSRATISAYKYYDKFTGENPFGFLTKEEAIGGFEQRSLLGLKIILKEMLPMEGSIIENERFVIAHFFFKCVTKRRKFLPPTLTKHTEAREVDEILHFLVYKTRYIKYVVEDPLAMLYELLSMIWPAYLEPPESFIYIFMSYHKKVKALGGKSNRKCNAPFSTPFHNDGRLALHLAVSNNWPWTCVKMILEADPSALTTMDSITGLYPFQIAAIDEFAPKTVETVFGESLSMEEEAGTRRTLKSEAYKFVCDVGEDTVRKEELNRLNNCYFLLRENPEVVNP